MNWNPLLYTELVNALTIPMEKNNIITIRLLSIYQILSITSFLLYMFFNSSRVKPNQYNIGLGYFRFIFGLFSILYYCFTINRDFNPIILINVISLIFSIIKNAELSNEMVDYNIVTSESIPYLTTIENYPDDTECTICLETITSNCTKLDCNHYFHLNCIRNWLFRGNSTCPLCRAQIFTPSESETTRV